MIVCLGTTPAVQRTMTFDRLIVDDVNRATSVRQFASGKSVNAARVLATLGERVIATGLVGGDTGRFVRLDLDRAGIPHNFVDASTSTRICSTLLDMKAKTATELVEEPGAVDPALADLLLSKLSMLLLHDVSVLVLSGTLAPGLADHFYAQCVRLAQNLNVKTLLDASGPSLTSALAERPTVVKPNRAELAKTLGVAIDSDDSLREAMKSVIDLGSQCIVVTNGPADTWLCNGKSFWRIATPKVSVVNPIGSGDSFAAGIAAGISRGLPLPEAARLGAACAAANAMSADAGHIARADVDDLLSRATIVER